MLIAFAGLLMSEAVPLLFVFAACYGAGQQTLFVVQTPFLAQHSRPEQRSELFSLQFAVMSTTQIGAALLGSAIAAAAASLGGFAPSGPEAHRVLLALMTALMLGALVTLLRLHRLAGRGERRDPEAPAAGADPAAGHRLRWLQPHVSDPRLFA